MNNINNLTNEIGYSFFWAEHPEKIAHCVVIEQSDEEIVVLRTSWGSSLPHLFIAPKLNLFTINKNNSYYLNKVFHLNTETIEEAKQIIKKYYDRDNYIVM